MNKVFSPDCGNVLIPRFKGFSAKSRGLFVCALFLTLPAFWTYAEEPKEFFLGIPCDVNFYSRSGIAFGGGLFFGFEGDGTALGIRTLYCRDMDNVQTLEVTAFVRVYVPDISGHSGLFAQLNLGPCLFWEEDNDERGVYCAGFGLGWRFLLGKRWFMEPSVRAGYPFLAGAGVAAGLRI